MSLLRLIFQLSGDELYPQNVRIVDYSWRILCLRGNSANVLKGRVIRPL